jgi:hypothetical protein
MTKVRQMVDMMEQNIKNWKDNLETQINQTDFDWPLMVHPIIPDEGMIIHYTPRWPLVLHYLCAITMFGMSSIYHLFNCKNEECCSYYIKFDYVGICVMIGGSGSAVIYYAFACQ